MLVDFGGRQNRPPSGGPCPDQRNRSRRRQSYIALLAEGRLIPPGVYNMPLLTEGMSQKSEVVCLDCRFMSLE